MLGWGKTMSEAPHRVLLVDDEEIVTGSIKTFLNLETNYEVIAFNSPRQALEFLKHNPVDLVIADLLMPDMNGIDFLAATKRLHPDAVRVLLTGYADKENAIKAINEIGLYQYLEKPWDNDHLRRVIAAGLERRRILKRLHAKIAEAEQVFAELREIERQIQKTLT
jgi:response regulator RpfG family c-di-GMP phosphodiesterase